MTSSTVSNSSMAAGLSENFKDFRLYRYEKDFPTTCEAPDKHGNYVEIRVFAGEKVLFAVKKVIEADGQNNSLQVWKFVWRLRNFCSRIEQINHPSSIYRGLAFAVFSPSNGRYTITGLRVNGDKISASMGELAEYLWSFVEDCVNDFVYGDYSFDGKDTLVRIPALYVKGTTAKEATPMSIEDAKAEEESRKSRVLKGIKLIETVVDCGKVKYPIIKLPLKMAGISTPEKLVAFPIEDICLYVDAAGFHTDRRIAGKVIHVMDNTPENFQFFCESYCGDAK